MTTVRFPDLQVVPIEQCLLHEETDGARVARLSARLAADGVLRNPPILGRHEGVEQLIVLDGATRVTALGALGYLARGDGRCLALGHSADLVARAAALRRLFAAYAGRATIARFPPAEWPIRLDEHGACVAVVYPTYAKRDLVALALAGAVLPAGITRHVIPGRALRINAPINQRPLAEKQAWLAGWLRDHQAGHHVRFYVEPTYLFDE